MEKITVKDLKDQTNMKGPRPFLYCQVCNDEYSANAGDYFMSKPDSVLECCGEPNILMTKNTVYKKVTQNEIKT